MRDKKAILDLGINLFTEITRDSVGNEPQMVLRYFILSGNGCIHGDMTSLPDWTRVFTICGEKCAIKMPFPTWDKSFGQIHEGFCKGHISDETLSTPESFETILYLAEPYQRTALAFYDLW